MLANFLNKSKPINFVSLLIFFLICFSITVYNTVFIDGFSLETFLKTSTLVLFFLAIFFIFNFINTKNKLTFDNSYAYFLCSILMIVILSELINYNTLLKTMAYLLFLRKIYSLRSHKQIIAKLFDSGFWLGILCILEPVSLLLFMLTYVGVYVHNKITIHTLFTPIVGFITPLIIYFAYNFWFDKTEEFTSLFFFDTSFNVALYSKLKYMWIISSTFFFSICTILIKSAKALSVNNTFKRSWILLIVNFFLAIFLTYFIPQKNGSELIYTLFPVAIILANGIELIQKRIYKNIVLYFVLIGCLFLQFFL